MKFYRYMSMAEFNKLSIGLTITGKRSYLARTTSAGVCFLGERTEFVDVHGKKREFTAEDCYDFLSGIVSRDILVEFEATSDQMEEGDGVYADPFSIFWDDCICITEYCVPAYSAETMRPLRYCFPEEFQWYDWN